jgi:Na+-transporting methylmalonyl-CoA/oxaloacetate decarboxylase gamma subunit
MLTFAQPHFGIVMLFAILLVLFVRLVARLTRRLLFAR